MPSIRGNRDYETRRTTETENPSVVPMASLDDVPQMISGLQSASAALDKVKGSPVITRELLAKLVESESKMRSAVDTLADTIAACKEIFGKANAGDDPVWVYRYVDADGKEGFVPKDEPDAELKARRLDADKMIEFGYAYPDKNNPGKFVGFHVTQNIDGTDRAKY